MKVALIHEVFAGADAEPRLLESLRKAAQRGARLAVLPELPLDPWPAYDQTPRGEDAEPPGGPRQLRLERVAKAAGIALLGGAITIEGDRRFNRALLVDDRGELRASYDKLHLPSEEGFWESDHYEAGEALPKKTDALEIPLGIQLCSDLNRPEGAALLAAQGAQLILGPRATPPSTYRRWLPVLRATALTNACYVISVNRPGTENGVPLGAPSVAIDPDGEILAETTEPLTVVSIEPSIAAAARKEYPGYLEIRAGLYARGWQAIGRES